MRKMRSNKSGWKRFQRRLARDLTYSPFLRILLFKFWFRMAFICFAGLIAFLGLFLPKIWTSSPPDYIPLVKVSGLDLVQAWSLRRTAVKEAELRNYNEACYAWFLALANNLADPRAARGLVGTVLTADVVEQKYQFAALGQTFNLLRLTQTNAADLDFVIELYQKLQRNDITFHVLRPLQDRLNPNQEAAFQKALFYSGRIKDYETRFSKWGSEIPEDKELRLIQAAYRAGWSGGPNSYQGKIELEEALNDPDYKIIAHRLRLALSAKLADPEGYEDSLRHLEDMRKDSPVNHAGYWQLLALTGDREKAAALAQAYPHPPATLLEAMRLADTYAVLGLPKFAHYFLKRFTPQFGHSEDYAVQHAKILIRSNDWEELRALAFEIRQRDRVRNILAGYSHYLEGLAEHRLHRPLPAKQAFEKAASLPFENPDLMFEAGSSMQEAGYPSSARQVLVHVEQNFATVPEYWNILFQAAYELKDDELMRKSARHGYELTPDSLVQVNRYAALLLLFRQNAELAVKLTFQVLSDKPSSHVAKINHSLALLLNHRVQEAHAILSSIDTSQLQPIETASFNLALFEVHLHQKNFEQAAQILNRIDKQWLFARQVQWLEEKALQLAPSNSTKKTDDTRKGA